MVHASLATSMDDIFLNSLLATSVDDIFLNSLLVTLQNKAFKALLLKFAALIVPLSQSIGASFGLIQPTSIACHTFSPRACKKNFHMNFPVHIVSTIEQKRNQWRLSTIHDNKGQGSHTGN